jgi:hypothetical protein
VKAPEFKPSTTKKKKKKKKRERKSETLPMFFREYNIFNNKKGNYYIEPITSI